MVRCLICFLFCVVVTSHLNSVHVLAQDATPAPAEKDQAGTANPAEPVSDKAAAEAEKKSTDDSQPEESKSEDKTAEPESEDKTAKSDEAASEKEETAKVVKEDSTDNIDGESKEEVAKKASKLLASPQLLPASTKAYFSVPDLATLEEKFDKTQLGLLGKDPKIRPFVDSLKEQVRDWLDQKNVRLGIQVEDLDKIQSGEIALAGVLQDLEGGQPARGSHGLVLLVDVSDSEQEAMELIAKVNSDLIDQGAAQERLEINDIEVSKTTIKHPKRIRHSQVSFQTVCNGWLLAADNEAIFRDIMRRLANPEKIKEETTLGAQESFQMIRKKTVIDGVDSQVQWFVDIFGYIQLAQAIADEEQETRPHRDDWARILQDQGFDAIRGIGGIVGFSHEEYEVLHRAFIYAPRKNLATNQKRVFDLFDFDSSENGPPTPSDWVPADVNTFLSLNWNFTKLLDSVGFVYDAFLEEGDFERMINDFKVDPDMQLDIPKLVGMLGNQITVISATEKPITETSERVVIGIPITGDPDFVFESVKRAVGRGNGELIKLAGIPVIEVDTTKEVIDPEEFAEDFDIPDDIDDEEEEEEEQREFTLFEKRYFVVHKAHLLIANEKNYLKKLLTKKQKVKLHETEDYTQVQEAVDKMIDRDDVSFRQFARIDQMLETNYEMLRSGKMGRSKTVLAKVLNKIFETEDQGAGPPKEREQKLDGSKLPSDYQESIAPYLGPSGWVLETKSDGWRMTGCILKKKQMSEVVKKSDDSEKPAKSHR